MGCRCGDICKYEKELKILGNAYDAVEKLLTVTNDVHDRLSDLKDEYSETVNADEGFLNEFHNLDLDSKEKVTSIRKKISDAQEALGKILKDARDEDYRHHEDEDD